MRRGSLRGRDEGDGRGDGEQGDGGGSRARRKLHTTGGGGGGGAASPGEHNKSGRQFDTPTSFRCLQCAVLKIKCSRTTPCERCFRLSLRCTPPTEAYLLSPAAAVEKIGVASPLLELVFRSMDLGKLSQCYVSVFLDWLGQGRIDRGVALATLQAHRVRSRQLGVDYSYGAVDGMARALGLSSVDLEDLTELMYEAPPPAEGAGASASCESLAEAGRLRAALEGSATWRFVSGPALAPSASVCLSIPSGPHTILLAKGDFLGARDIVRTRNARRIMGPLLYAGLIAPDDWRSWFELDVAATLTADTQPCSRFIKALEMMGGIELYLFTSRRVFVEEAGMTCRLVMLEPMPASRHLCPILHPHRVVNTYRHSLTPRESLLGGGGQAQAPAWVTARTAGGTEGYGQQQLAPAISHLLPCLPGLAALPAPPYTLSTLAPTPPPARSMEPAVHPFAPATMQAGFQTLNSTVASDVGAPNAIAAPRGPPPPPSTAGGAFVQRMQEEVSDDSDLLSAALDAFEDGSDAPLFDGEEGMMEAAWAQGWRGTE